MLGSSVASISSVGTMGTIGQEMVAAIASKRAGWEPAAPEENVLRSLNEDQLRGLCGTIHDPASHNQQIAKDPAKQELAKRYAAVAYPREFDARKEFSQCTHPIRNQLQCGSCWYVCTLSSCLACAHPSHPIHQPRARFPALFRFPRGPISTSV